MNTVIPLSQTTNPVNKDLGCKNQERFQCPFKLKAISLMWTFGTRSVSLLKGDSLHQDRVLSGSTDDTTYHICPNRSAVHLSINSINFNNKACHPVPTIRIYTVNRNRVNLCLQVAICTCVAAKQTGIPLEF